MSRSPAARVTSATSFRIVSVKGFVAFARCTAAENFTVAIICMVLVMRRMVLTATMRFLMTRIWAMGRVV